MLVALNKYYRAVSYNEYMNEWDLPMVQNAIIIADFSEKITDWIWEKEIKPFQIF